MYQEDSQTIQMTKCLLMTKMMHLKLNPPLQKVLEVCPMFNGTAVILAITGEQRESVLHVDSKGKILNERNFIHTNFNSLCILSDRQILFVDTQNSYIRQWNLQTYEKLDFPFFYNKDLFQSHEIFFFSETQLICVVESGSQFSNHIKFSYFKYPLLQNDQPVLEYQDTEIWNYQHMIKKANQKSMLVWFKTYQNKFLEFTIFELQKQNNSFKVNCRKIRLLKSTVDKNNHPTDMSVGNIWEMCHGKYMIVSMASASKLGEDQYPGSFYVYEQNKKENSIRPANFKIDNKFNIQITEFYSKGRFSVVKTFNNNKGNKLSPVYYIDNEKQKIIAKQEWKCRYLTKQTSTYSDNTFLDSQYENVNVKQIICKEKKLFTFNEVTTFLLTEFIQNPHQALVESIILLLHCQQQEI